MKSIATIQVIFCVYTFLFAYFQVPFIKGFRDYVPMNNPYVNQFHNRGAALSIFVGSLLAGYYSFSYRAFEMLFLFFNWYLIVFDMVIGEMVYSHWQYIGHTAKIDRWLSKTFPEDAGVVKTLICFVLIIGLNILLAMT